jgi:hypothetical protein
MRPGSTLERIRREHGVAGTSRIETRFTGGDHETRRDDGEAGKADNAKREPTHRRG